MIKYSYIKLTGCLVAAALAPLCTSAQRINTEASVERLKSESLQFSYSDNASGIQLDQMDYYSQVGLGYDIEKGSFKRAQEGEHNTGYRFFTDGGGTMKGLKGAAAREKTLEYLRDVGIADPEVRFKQYPHEFSGGMRQRVVIAIAVACNPQILICDEPTTALDVTIQAQILELLKEMRVKYNLTIILITHDLGVVANIADRVAVMYAGDIVEIGTSDEIYYDPRHPYTWALLSSMPQMGVKGEDLFNIQGTPPSLFTEIHGDAFAPRNPLALKIDFVKRPPYFDVSTTHRAKTWLLDPRAPKIEPPAAVRMLQEEGK